MRVLIYQHKNRGEQALARSIGLGIQKEGDALRILSKTEFDPRDLENADIVFTGRLSTSGPVMEACAARGVNFVYFDKGYFYRGWKTDDPGVYYRFSINAFQPLDYFQLIPRPGDRWKKLDVRVLPRQKRGSRIVVTGCSQKFSRMHGFTNEDFTRDVVAKLKALTDRPIVYRPKPTDNHPEHIPGTIFSYDQRSIEEELKDAYAVVTFSSNAAADAVIAGVPAFVLGPSIARPAANTDLAKINDPWFPSDKERMQWCHDLAYCQWTAGEMEDGTMWRELKRTVSQLKIQMSKNRTLASVL